MFIRVYFQRQRMNLFTMHFKNKACILFWQAVYGMMVIKEDRMFSDDLCCKMHSDFLFTCIQEGKCTFVWTCCVRVAWISNIRLNEPTALVAERKVDGISEMFFIFIKKSLDESRLLGGLSKFGIIYLFISNVTKS